MCSTDQGARLFWRMVAGPGCCEPLCGAKGAGDILGRVFTSWLAKGMDADVPCVTISSSLSSFLVCAHPLGWPHGMVELKL